MKEYPTISRVLSRGESIYAFDKLDGSNIRAEWSRKKCFYKYGKRRGLLDHSNPSLLAAPDLIQTKYAGDLNERFRDCHWMEVIAFFEFWGPHSFAGSHEPTDQHTVTLIDVSVKPKGILVPRDFLKVFEGIDHAKMLYHGPFTGEFEQEVRKGSLPGMTFEGVVAKGSLVSPGMPLMFKVKSDAWIARLKEKCGSDERLFNELL